MNDDLSNGATPLDEQLVAYLDGELDAESSHRIDELLATDAEVRCRLHEMERTWDLLDDLDTVPVGDKFSQTTLEMVAVAARDDVEQSLAEAPRRRRRRWMAIGGGLLAAVMAGFLAVVLLMDPNRQLLEDLPVLENLDQLRPVDTIEFLRMLRDAGLFSHEAGETPDAAAAQPDESLAQRRHRIESMSLGEKERLLQLRERFDALDQDQQRRLRRLYSSLQADADAPQLCQVMRRYGEWLKTLSSYARAELLEMGPGERLKSVKRLHEEQQTRDDVRRPGSNDVEKLLKWTNDYAAAHEKEFLETLLDPQQRKRLAELAPPRRYRWVFLLMSQRRLEAGADKPPAILTDADLAQLRERLSLATRQRMESKTAAQQWQLVVRWMRHAPGERPSRGAFQQPDDQRLADFFEHELPPEEQSRLLSMSGEEMQRELQRQYFTRTRLGGPGHRSEDHPRGNRFGGERPAPKNLPQPAAKP